MITWRLALATFLLAGCTTVGTHDDRAHGLADFGPVVTLRLCAYLDEGITPEEVAAILEDAWDAESAKYGVVIRLVGTTRWRRPAFTAPSILQVLAREKLVAPCDRIIAFVGRHPGDVLWGLFMPQVLGAVDDLTPTHGYIVARAVSLDQAFLPPADVLRHELHHMLGCTHARTLAGCYERIAHLKRAHEGDFFPAWSFTLDRLLPSREEINRLRLGA